MKDNEKGGDRPQTVEAREPSQRVCGRIGRSWGVGRHGASRGYRRSTPRVDTRDLVHICLNRPMLDATHPLADIVEAQHAFLEKEFVGKIVLVHPE